MSIKTETFTAYTNDQLKSTRETLSQAFNDANCLKALPLGLMAYIKKENPQGGNDYTRIGRCISIIDRVIVSRFIKGEIA